MPGAFRGAGPLRDQRGAVMVEYVVVLCLVAVPACLGFVVVGRHFVDHYHLQRLVLGLPFP